MRWDPDRYLTYAGERGRPFVELLGRVDPEGDTWPTGPRRVVDLGCGPGNLTALLARRWPKAEVVGVDSSAEMLRTAADGVGTAGGRLTWEQADVREWAPSGGAVDVVITNATLQWVPRHRALLPRLVEAVTPGGWFAMQVPGNFDEPGHTLRADVADRAPYAEHVVGVAHPASDEPDAYLATLADLGCAVDAWETTYLHVLPADDDPDPVFTWVSATGARPTLQALPDDLRPAFERDFKAALREAYPAREVGGRPAVVMPFRRVFAVARRAS